MEARPCAASVVTAGPGPHGGGMGMRPSNNTKRCVCRRLYYALVHNVCVCGGGGGGGAPSVLVVEGVGEGAMAPHKLRAPVHKWPARLCTADCRWSCRGV